MARTSPRMPELEERVSLVVTGIAQMTQAAALEGALRAAGFPVDSLTVISAEEGFEGHADSGIRFVHSGSDAARSFLATGTLGITSMGGVDVPGMSGSSFSTPEYFPPETLADELGDVEIPDSQLGNYLEAIEAGHSVFVYYATPESRERVEQIFRDNAIGNVQTF